jgi:hypothetical protein
MKTSIYADGLTNIVMVDGVVRFDLVTVANASKSAKNEIEMVASVATTLPGFLRMHDQMAGVIKNMVDQGLIKLNPASDVAKAEG